MQPAGEDPTTHGPKEIYAHLAKALSGRLRINGLVPLNPGEVTPVCQTMDAAHRKALSSTLVQAPTART